jgi:hypothetical protein
VGDPDVPYVPYVGDADADEDEGGWVYVEGEAEGPGGWAYDAVGEFVERFANAVEGEVEGLE